MISRACSKSLKHFWIIAGEKRSPRPLSDLSAFPLQIDQIVIRGLRMRNLCPKEPRIKWFGIWHTCNLQCIGKDFCGKSLNTYFRYCRYKSISRSWGVRFIYGVRWIRRWRSNPAWNFRGWDNCDSFAKTEAKYFCLSPRWTDNCFNTGADE